MLVTHPNRSTISVGEFETAKFTIANSASAYRILSSGIYSDKISSIIRELSCNMYDAHVAADTLHIQPLVHLPCLTESYWYIRDFGTGLSHEDVMTLYTKYFFSDKTDSNKFVGCLGLGSKSPFSYTNSFTVESFYNGFVRHYICNLSEEHFPQIQFIKDSFRPTKEHNGLKISFAVKQGDFGEFLTKSQKIYAYFQIQPKFVGPVTVNIKCPKHVLESTTWKMRENDYEKSKLIMGNIAYPINPDKIKDCPQNILEVLNRSIDIYVNIGDVDFSTSRESLSYTNKTCNTLKSFANIIISEASSIISDKLNACKSLWQARCLAHDILWTSSSDLSVLSRIADVKNLTWNNIQLDNVRFIKVDIECKSFTRDTWHYRRGIRIGRNNRCINIVPNTLSMIVENDLNIGAISRCDGYLRGKEAGIIYLVKFESAAERANFINILGINSDEIVLASSLPAVSKTRNTSSRYSNSAKIYRFTAGDYTRQYSYWKDETINMADGGVYVELNRYAVIFGDNNNYSPQNIQSIINNLTSLGIKVNLYGVRKDVAKPFKTSSKWINFFDYVKNLLNIANVNNKIANLLYYSDVSSKLEYKKYWVQLLRVKEKIKDKFVLDNLQVFNPLLENDISKVGHYRIIADKIGYVFKSDVKTTMTHTESDLLSKRPMLKYVFDSYYESMSSSELSKCVDYCNLFA